MKITKKYLFSEFKNWEGFRRRIVDLGSEFIDTQVIYSKVSYILVNRETKTETEYSTLSEAINHLSIPDE